MAEADPCILLTGMRAEAPTPALAEAADRLHAQLVERSTHPAYPALRRALAQVPLSARIYILACTADARRTGARTIGVSVGDLAEAGATHGQAVDILDRLLVLLAAGP